MIKIDNIDFTKTSLVEMGMIIRHNKLLKTFISWWSGFRAWHFILVLFYFPGVSQELNLPADSILYNSLIDYHENLKDAELEIYNIKNKHSWLNYLPSIGITYFTGKPRPLISYNVTSLTNAYRDKSYREAEKLSLVKKSNLSLEVELGELERMIRKFKAKNSLYQEQLELLEIDQEIFKFDEAKYKEALMKPSQFLEKKKRVQQQKLNSQKYYYELTELYYSVLKTAKFKITETSIVQK